MLIHTDTPLDELFHEYDPVAAREYYLRTRELKGRKPGAGAPPVSVKNAAQAAAKAKEQKQRKEAERKKARAALETKLGELEVRLDQLNRKVKQAKADAMRRAGGVSEETLSRMISMEVKEPGSTKKKGAAEEAAKGEKSGGAKADAKPKEKTAAQKKDAAKAAKEKYEEEHPDAGKKDASNSDLQEKVDAATEKLAKLQKRIEAMARIGA